MNRRNWLKASLGISSAAILTPALINELMARPMNSIERNYFQALQIPKLKIRLNANENPYGPSDKARAMAAELLTQGNRYPLGVAEELKEMIAAKEGVSPDHIALGAGSSELLCASGAAFAVEGGAVLSADPTFPLLMNYAETFHARWDKVNVNEKLEIDYQKLSAAIRSDTRLVVICNPNNPTGTSVDGATIRKFCEEVSPRVPVFADEAYIEFLEPSQQMSMVELVKKGLNVIVAKTFSKIYGLAGLRIGYAIAKPDLIKKIGRYQIGFGTGQPAIAAAKASLGDETFMATVRNKNSQARKILTDYLDRNGYFYGQSVTNFVFFDPKGEGKKFLDKLAEKQIGIRVWDYNGRIWNRISVGTVEEMNLLVRYLGEI